MRARKCETVMAQDGAEGEREIEKLSNGKGGRR